MVLGHDLGSGVEALRILAYDTEGRHVSLGHHLTVLRALRVGMRELEEDGWTGIAVIGVNDGANPLLYGRV